MVENVDVDMVDNVDVDVDMGDNVEVDVDMGDNVDVDVDMVDSVDLDLDVDNIDGRKSVAPQFVLRWFCGCSFNPLTIQRFRRLCVRVQL